MKKPPHRHLIAENEHFFSFLEPKRLRPGHTVIFPKVKTDWFFDLDDKTLTDLMLFAKPIARAIRCSMPCQKVAMVVYGLKVRHAHMHLVPVDGTLGELDLANGKKASEAELSSVGKKIRKALAPGSHRLLKDALFSPSA